jgi:hypothetical protein
LLPGIHRIRLDCGVGSQASPTPPGPPRFLPGVRVRGHSFLLPRSSPSRPPRLSPHDPPSSITPRYSFSSSSSSSFSISWSGRPNSFVQPFNRPLASPPGISSNEGKPRTRTRTRTIERSGGYQEEFLLSYILHPIINERRPFASVRVDHGRLCRMRLDRGTARKGGLDEDIGLQVRRRGISLHDVGQRGV